MRSQWFRAGSLASCLIVACGCSSASQSRANDGGDPPGTPAAAPAPAPAAPAATESTASEPVVRRAREALKAANVAGAETAKLLSVEPHQWNDSSLGCPRKGEMYMQVITDGHIVKFDVGGAPVSVNVAGEAAVICNQLLSDRPPKRPGVPVRAVTFQKAVDEAKKDLAAKLGVPVSEIKMVGSVPFVWTDGTFRCGAAGDARPEVRGYKLQLARGQDAFYYHTDFETTFACPPVEAQ